MRFCETHWAVLQAAIEVRGLVGFVPSGPDAAAALVSEINNGIIPDNFDPLMYAHWSVISCLTFVDHELLYQDGCPLCIANTVHRDGCNDPLCRSRYAFYDIWIEFAANDAKAEWERIHS